MPVFQDAQGLAVKFFIQKDLPQHIQAELCETITSLGGRVESKVPRSGYVLVQPGTPDEERLRLCWATPDRPERYFVPYTYVEACKIAGMLLRQIFVDEGTGQPIKMCIHASIANVNARSALAQRIMHSGGDPTASMQSARVILADPNTEVFQHLVKTYQGVPDKYIENYLWVRKCVERGSVVYTPLVYKNPGGRRPGEERTQFTDDDEDRLCSWIATKIPFKEMGGRTGNRLYQLLCEQAHDPDYAWVTRHTWQSWRERYKKNADRLDNIIAAIVQQRNPQRGEKGQYGYVRQAEARPKRARRKRTKDQDGNGADEPAPGAEEEEDMPIMGVGAAYNVPAEGVSMAQANAGAGPSAAVRRSPAEEEMDDDGSEWAVRVGNEEPPAWAAGAKRRATPEAEQSDPSKRQRIEQPDAHVAAWQQQFPPAPMPVPAVLDPILHVIDQTIRDIAEQYRFTVDEVQEFYDRVGDMERTRRRFHAMREELTRRFYNDDV